MERDHADNLTTFLRLQAQVRRIDRRLDRAHLNSSEAKMLEKAVEACLEKLRAKIEG